MVDEGTWLQEFFARHPWIGGLIMAFMTSILRVVYDNEETRFGRIVLESAICGALTLTAGSALLAMGYSQAWYMTCGGVIGFMGSQAIRALAYKLINKKVG